MGAKVHAWALAGEGVRFLVRIAGLLQDRVAMREWDVARAAKRKRLSFWADIAVNFFIFRSRGGARAGGREDPPQVAGYMVRLGANWRVRN